MGIHLCVDKKLKQNLICDRQHTSGELTANLIALLPVHTHTHSYAKQSTELMWGSVYVAQGHLDVWTSKSTWEHEKTAWVCENFNSKYNESLWAEPSTPKKMFYSLQCDWMQVTLACKRDFTPWDYYPGVLSNSECSYSSVFGPD